MCSWMNSVQNVSCQPVNEARPGNKVIALGDVALHWPDFPLLFWKPVYKAIGNVVKLPVIQSVFKGLLTQY